MSGESVRVAYPLFPMEGGGSIPTSPLQFEIFVIELDLARRLNKLWHSRLPNTSAANLIRSRDHIYFGACFENIWYASAIWTSPIAKAFNGLNYLELRRMAIAPDAPKNTASRMIGIMTRKIKKFLPHIVKLISYQDTEVHTGTIYKAVGWTIGRITKKGETNWGEGARGKLRNKPQTEAIKIRWEKDL